MKINWVTCIKCKKQFYAKDDIINSKLPLHCPFCDTYFHSDSSVKGKKGKR